MPVLLLLAAGLGVRLLYLATPALDSDQAIFGLMAIHILKGELPIFQWGYHYMGTIESFVAAPLMLVFGPSRFALNLSPVLFNLLFTYAAYRFAREAAGRAIGLWALAFACLPPCYLVWNTVVARGAYSETLALGTLAAYFALRAVGDEGERAERRALIGAGFALGLSFWTHLNTVIYGAAIFLFWLIEKPRLLRRAIPWAGLAFFVGSAPFWIGTIESNFATFDIVAPPGPRFSHRFSRFLSYRLPVVLGIRYDNSPLRTLPYIAWLILPIQVAAIAATAGFALRSNRPALKRAARLLLLLTAMLFIVYLASPYSGADTQRYLTPLYSMLAVAPAFLILRLGGAASRVGVALGLSLIALQAVPTVAVVKLFHADALRDYREDREEERRLIQAIADLGFKVVYSDNYWDGARFTFDALERVIFANPFEDRSRAYLDLADGVERPAFLFHEPAHAAAFEGTLALAGARYQKRDFEGFLLYYDIDALPGGGTEIPVVAATAGDNSADAPLALDRDAATRWQSMTPQKPGMWFRVDLGSEREVAEVALWPRFSPDTPRGLRVEVSSDGERWQKVTEGLDYFGPCSWVRNRPLPSYDGWVVARFAPVACRWIRLTVLGEDSRYSLAIDELVVRGPGVGSRPGGGAGAAPAVATPPQTANPTPARFLTDPVLAARFPGAVRHWQGELIPGFEQLRDASLVGTDDRLIVAENDPLARGHTDDRIGVTASQVTPFAGDVLIGGLRRDTDELERRSPARWREDLAAETAVVDLGAENEIAGVIVEHGENGSGLPRGLAARVSSDGTTWTDPEPLTARPAALFWSDQGLMGASFRERIFLFPTPRRTRFVELTASPRNVKVPWTLKKVTALLPAKSPSS